MQSSTDRFKTQGEPFLSEQTARLNEIRTALVILKQAQAVGMEGGESTVPEVGERMVRPGIWKREQDDE